ncbi:feline leukemia virus subgroup C receptor-related protein 2 [Microplitis mediator]|uniref:feline leukemia virus subgroup C receptor-related protein 2 n=1 Tax=Microplitis mediator TaxID=375433 RepID=UPI0025562719|nr:feline leukemia virus subgroup C receptor-related protein 2 [Microplitis mediator]
MSRASADYVKAVEGGIQPTEIVETKIYRIRWFILAIFVIYSASNAMQWIQYSIITNIVMKYYKIENSLPVDMTSMIYMITYIPFIFPASYILDRYGLRYAALAGGFGTALGSWVKVFSVGQDQFWIAFIGQTIVASSQCFILSVPARLAAVWFGPDQVSSACSIGVFGNQLGIAIGFLFPPMLVKNSDDPTVIGDGLRVMNYMNCAITTVIFFLILFFFKAKPPLPPSPVQAVQNELEKSDDFLRSLKRLGLNFGYMMLLMSYGINVGIFYAISTLLSRIIDTHFPGSEEDAGRMGLAIVCSGMLGSVLCGVILDKTRKFKETTLVVYIFSLLGLILFTFILNSGTIIVFYVTLSLLGFFMTGYLPVGFEFAAELTYPEPEGTSAGLLNALVQVFGIIFIMIYGYLIDITNDFWATFALCCVLAVGTVITAIIPNNLRRQNAK